MWTMHFHNHFLKKLIFIDAQILSSEEGDVGLAMAVAVSIVDPATILFFIDYWLINNIRLWDGLHLSAMFTEDD